MTGPKEKSQFRFPETLSVHLGGTLRVEGKHNSLFPLGPVIKCFVIPHKWKWTKLNPSIILAILSQISQIQRSNNVPSIITFNFCLVSFAVFLPQFVLESVLSPPWLENWNLENYSDFRISLKMGWTRSQIYRGFKTLVLITCKSKVQAVVSLSS